VQLAIFQCVKIKNKFTFIYIYIYIYIYIHTPVRFCDRHKSLVAPSLFDAFGVKPIVRHDGGVK
jgi:hypothetical protein